MVHVMAILWPKKVSKHVFFHNCTQYCEVIIWTDKMERVKAQDQLHARGICFKINNTIVEAVQKITICATGFHQDTLYGFFFKCLDILNTFFILGSVYIVLDIQLHIISSLLLYKFSQIKLYLRNFSFLLFFIRIISSVFKPCLSWFSQVQRSSVLLLNRCWIQI